MTLPSETRPARKPRRRLLTAIWGFFLASTALLALLLVLPVSLRLGNFELAAYLRAEADPAEPRPGATYLTATGFRGEKSAELILRLGNGSLRIAWVITP